MQYVCLVCILPASSLVYAYFSSIGKYRCKDEVRHARVSAGTAPVILTEISPSSHRGLIELGQEGLPLCNIIIMSAAWWHHRVLAYMVSHISSNLSREVKILLQFSTEHLGYVE